MRKKSIKHPLNIHRQEKTRPPSAFSRIMKYASLRAASILIALVIGVYFAVVVTNFGGFVDDIYRDRIIWFSLAKAMELQEAEPPLSKEEKHEILDQYEADLTEAYGLNEPFFNRTIKWTRNALTFNWGEARWLESLWGPEDLKNDIRMIVLSRLPNSLLLFGTANIVAFFASVFSALALSQKLGRWADRFFIALTPLTSAPAWIYGLIILILIPSVTPIQSSYAHIESWRLELLLESQTTGEKILLFLRGFAVPALAIIVSVFFQSVYTWRTFFALHVNEDYVEMAKAKGLSPRVIERKYLLRPALPTIITSFAMMLITFWQGLLALEFYFNFDGIGKLFLTSLFGIQNGIVMSVIVLFAYLMGITVFLLDFIHAVIDPRVRLGGNGNSVHLKVKPRFRWFKRRDKVRIKTSLKKRVRQGDRARGKSQKQKITRNKWSFGRAGSVLREMRNYPSAMIGLAFVVILVIVSIVTVIALPYDQAVKLWRSVGIDYYAVPRLAQPEWINFFRKNDLPPSIVLNTWEGTAEKQVVEKSNQMTEFDIWYEFDYQYKYFPQDVYFYLDTSYGEKKPYLILTWINPDGLEIELYKGSMGMDKLTSFTWIIRDEFKGPLFGGEGVDSMAVLFSDPALEEPVPIPGTYKLHLEAFTFEEGRELDAELAVVGLVHGLGGTDDERHNLILGLLWGLPVALAFGLIGAVGTSVAQMTLAGLSAWYGGWVDGIIQRITEINIVLPVLPLAMTINYLYGKTIWHILGIIVLLSIFGSGIKNYRAVFMQVKEDPYIEAARAYGASNLRIIFKYLVPRIIPMLIPRLIMLIPGYVFLEATLAFLGVGDRFIPTWGKLINQALFISDAISEGYYFVVLEPIAFLLVTGFAFSLLGIALERILNPRLQDS